MRLRAAPAALVGMMSALLAPHAWSQTKAGGEFLVNTYTTGNQLYSALGRDARGNFVVVWDDRNDYIVKGQRYDRAGNTVGTQFNVNTSDYAYFPGMTMGPKGNFVVVWVQYPDNGSPDGGIRGQRFDAAANRVGAEFQVNTYTTGYQRFPNVALDGQGNFVVMWWSLLQDGSGDSIQARRFDAQGNPRGDQFLVNSYTTGNQFFGDISSDAAGNFVVAWTSNPGTDLNGLSVNGQRYAADGTPQGANFQINTYTTGNQASVGVSHFADGSFIVGFFSNQFEADTGVVAKRYDASGNPVGVEFQVNTYTTTLQGYPDFALDARGNFVVSWWSFAGDGSDRSVFARRFRADGTPRGSDFLVNTYTTGRQTPHRMSTTIASDEVGNFVINWWSPQFTGAGLDNIAQRFGGLHPNTLAVDTTGNLVWEPGETVDARPAWFNANGAPQTVGGTLTNLTGPPGAVYTLVDGTANYGTIANNASGVCSDCYMVQVDDPATRPALHWDASAVETITPDTQGQEKLRPLHIGESFLDVSLTNPFYRFIEILLHNSITSGCGGGNYCPGDPTSRAQMSVFVLVAKDGPGFSPPACGTPVFADVPASDPFCRFIEELFRRGVVSGCATNPPRYCPNDPVTRAQMSVFVLLTLDPTLNPPACTVPIFADVPASDPFCRWIEELFRRGVVSGCAANPARYCPNDPVTREQMGVFISVTFGLVLYGP